MLEYFFPYHDLLEEDWADCLEELISAMLDGSDEYSYQTTILMLLSKLHDNHVYFDTHPYSPTTGSRGASYDRLSVTEAEGVLVVSATPENCPLKLGDVILRVNRTDVEEIAQLLKVYVPCSREEIFLSRYASTILVAMGINDPQAEVTVLRDGTEETFLSSYFTTKYAPVFVDASSSKAVPGAYIREIHSAGYQPSDERRGVYHYDKPVVVLVNEHTQSAGEWAAWSIGKGENVVLMGQNTSGALNRIGNAPLPGGFWFTFTAVRAELDDGSQLQRVGLTPDIPVARTIQGIKEGRDELMEAAVQYIIDNQ